MQLENSFLSLHLQTCVTFILLFFSSLYLTAELVLEFSNDTPFLYCLYFASYLFIDTHYQIIFFPVLLKWIGDQTLYKYITKSSVWSMISSQMHAKFEDKEEA